MLALYNEVRALIQAEEPPPARTVQDELQWRCDALLDDATGVTWDLYRPDQKRELELKIRLNVFPESVVTSNNGEYKFEVPENPTAIQKNAEAMALHITDRIWKQSKHTPGCLRMSVVYIGLVKVKPGSSPLNALEFFIRPLFRTMKCVDGRTRSAAGKCMVFVDEFGWVYQNFNEFMANTLYPDTIIVAPEQGVFRRANSGTVQLFYFSAPHTAAQIEKEYWGNIGMTVGGIGSAALLVGSAFVPIAAPIIWGAVGVGGIVGAVSGYNSATQLIKRNRHEQDIGLADKESRAHWLAISGTILALGASGATAILRGAATAGNVGKGLIYTSNTINGASMFVNGASIGNSIFEVTSSDRDATLAEVSQLAISLFLFAHSVKNFQSAHELIHQTQSQHLNDYKQTLSKNGQKRFRNKMNRRIREGGVSTARGDTIRNLNTAEHYKTNFRGTSAYKSSAGLAENARMRENVANMTFYRFIPHCKEALVAIYTTIVIAVGNEYWELFKKMAERILERINNDQLTLEGVIRDCYDIVVAYAERRNIRVEDVLMSVNGLRYESIPRFIREYFELLIPSPGELVCKECKGCKWIDI